MREQSEKLSFEIRQNYKSTLRTVTETSDQSSKRYVLKNDTLELINYELRRKMRQVAVQVQDIGTYLCWDTYVDEPGNDLGLANLVHIAQPADLLPVPDQTLMPYPADQIVTFRANATWNWGDNRRYGFVPLTVIDQPPAPAGYEAVITPAPIPVARLARLKLVSSLRLVGLNGMNALISCWAGPSSSGPAQPSAPRSIPQMRRASRLRTRPPPRMTARTRMLS
jgi:hypothetical protein